MLSVVSQTQLLSGCRAPKLCGMSQAQLVILSHRLCCVYIVEEQLSSVAESRRLVDLVDSSSRSRLIVQCSAKGADSLESLYLVQYLYVKLC